MPVKTIIIKLKRKKVQCTLKFNTTALKIITLKCVIRTNKISVGIR